MTVSNATGGRSRNLVLAAMIFAVSMTFIDQTIVSIAVPEIQKELGLTSTGVQWAVNAYLLTLAALFAFGGRLADTVGHTKMVTLGVIVFAGASALCGLNPKGSFAEAWIVIFRAVQGVSAISSDDAWAVGMYSCPRRSDGAKRYVPAPEPPDVTQALPGQYLISAFARASHPASSRFPGTGVSRAT